MKARLRAYPMVLLLLPLVAAILLYDHFYPSKSKEAAERDYAFVITSNAKPTPKCERFETQLIAQRDSGEVEWQAAQGEVYLYLLRDSANTLPGYYDTVIAHTTVEYDRRIGRAFAARYTLQPSEDAYQPSLQERLYRRLESAGINGDELAIVGALTLGYKEDLDPEVKHRFQSSGAAVLILLVRPTDLWSVSFQLSFSATFAIVVMASSLERFLHRQDWKSRALGWVVGMVIVSIAAQLGTLPITMYNFGQVSTYFLLTNLIVLPLATLLVPFGLMSIVLGGSWLGVLIGKVTWRLAWMMNESVGWIESLPGSTVSAHIDGLMIGLYYGLFLLFYVLVIKKPQ